MPRAGIGKNVLLMAASLLLSILLGELGLRAFFFRESGDQGYAAAVLWERVKRKIFHQEGLELNKKAWDASFSERGLTVPPGGPREGFWGSRIGLKTTDPLTLWREPAKSMSGLFEMDDNGWEHAGSPEAKYRILILGGSVAWGAYASQEKTSYFHRLSDRLAQMGLPARITVIASGGWVSDQELLALTARGLALRPDIVVFLDGFNDLTNKPDVPMGTRALDYLANATAAIDFCSARQMKVAFFLQPFLSEKPNPSVLEKLILALPFNPDDTDDGTLSPLERAHALKELRTGVEVLREGLRSAINRSTLASFTDCSGIFNDQKATTFSDYCHFSDPGHEILARAMAEHLAALLQMTSVSDPARGDRAGTGLPGNPALSPGRPPAPERLHGPAPRARANDLD